MPIEFIDGNPCQELFEKLSFWIRFRIEAVQTE